MNYKVGDIVVIITNDYGRNFYGLQKQIQIIGTHDVWLHGTGFFKFNEIMPLEIWNSPLAKALRED